MILTNKMNPTNPPGNKRRLKTVATYIAASFLFVGLSGYTYAESNEPEHEKSETPTLASPHYKHEQDKANHSEHDENNKAGEVQVAATQTDENTEALPPIDVNIRERMNIREETTPETTDLLGEKIDLNTGALSFHHTDVSLPGNFPLDVAIRRVYRGKLDYTNVVDDFADWHLDIPHIYTTYVSVEGKKAGSWPRGYACSQDLSPGRISGDPDHGWMEARQFWNGDTLSVPGIVKEKLLLPGYELLNEIGGDIQGVTRVTKSNWRIKCFETTDHTGRSYEGFKAYAPDGTIYTFDKLRDYQFAPYTGRWTTLKYHAYMLVSEVEDRFGNKVTYDYDDQTRLKSIRASDGRHIALFYDELLKPNNISRIAANGREWRYVYSGQHTTNRKLVRVVLPDERAWIFDLERIGMAKPFSSSNNLCNFIAPGDEQFVGKITHPGGATGIFEIKETLHGVSRLDITEAYGSQHDRSRQIIPKCNAMMSLTQKTLTGPGLTPMTWTYSYSQNKGLFDTEMLVEQNIPQESQLAASVNVPAPLNRWDYKTTTVKAPDGSKTRYFYNRDWSSVVDGSVQAVQQYDVDGTTLLSTTISEYEAGNWVGHTAMDFSNTRPFHYRVNKTREVTTLHHSDGDTIYTTRYLAYNNLGSVLKTHSNSSAFPGKHQYTKHEYINHVSGDYYVLQLPIRQWLSATDSNDYQETVGTSYYAWHHQYKSKPHQERRFAVLLRENVAYHDDGNLQKVEYNIETDVSGQKRYQQYDNYKLGQPQTFTQPARHGAGQMHAYQVVDNNGQVTQSTDFNGNCTSYDYDNMGRLTLIDPCDQSWANTQISYEQVSGAEEVGIIAGMYRQTFVRGHYRKTRYLDALSRPVLVKTEDTTIAGSAVFQKTTFNPYNKPVFMAYTAKLADNDKGITTSYDGAQREISVARSGVTRPKTLTYLTGNKRTETNSRGFSTTTTYLAYGEPAYDMATFIESPEGVTTDIKINLFGNIDSISQGGMTEYRYYDDSQRLCQTYRADVGKSVYHYNAFGEMDWYTEGASGVIDSCSRTDVQELEKVYLSYDNHGQLIFKDFKDPNTSDIAFGFDNNGNQVSVSSGASNWTYRYNSLNLPDSETLTLEGQTFAFTYAFDSLGNLASLTYPSGRKVDYAPNALGQATKAGSHATNAQYHANGTLTGFTFGNDSLYHLELDQERLLPKRLATYQGSKTVTDLSYTFDPNNNVLSITDGVDDDYNVSMNYDGLDRLISANGKWGNNTSISYDTMGNILSRQLGSLTVSYSYDPLNKRLISATASGSENQSYNFSYDTKGAVTHNGNFALHRNQAGQVTSANGHRFIYDGNGKRVIDEKDGTKRYSIYNQSGKMLYQWDQATETVTDYIFLGNQLIAEAQVALGDGSQNKDNTNVGYTGHQLDEDLGLNYMQARYYDPVIGRFYSNDPLGTLGHFNEGNLQGFNRYAYANNSPYKYTDPTGEAGRLVVGGAKVIYKLYRRYEKTGTLDKKDLREVSGQELADAVGDLYTIFGDQSASIVDKVKAGVDLVAGLETNNKGNKVAEEVLESASSIGSKLVKQFKNEGTGQGAGRSGGHGTPFKKAGAELIRQANKLNKNDPQAAALKKEGKRLIKRGKSINHKN